MRLAERLGRPSAQPGQASASFVQDSARDLASITAGLHSRILDKLDLAVVAQLSAEDLRTRLKIIVEQVILAERLAVSDSEREAVVVSVLDELTGHGPIETLLNDPTISDVLVNGYDKVFIERAGKLVKVDVRFRDDRHLIHTIQRMVAKVGRRVDESSPMVDARLPDGSRVNAIIPPLAVDGPSLSIRRFGSKPLEAKDLVRNGAMTEEMVRYLEIAVKAKCSILIAGGTGAGKTTLLNMLSAYIPSDERIISAEDAAELRMLQPHVVRLEARPPNLEGKGEVTIRDLVRNALRMRPDRIVVGEVRGGEVLDMLQAMNTGHDGSLATIHANSAEDAVSRLMTMLGMTGTTFSEETMATLISRAVHVIMHVSRMQDGKRRITAISEIGAQTGTQIQLVPIYTYERTGLSADGTVLGRHVQRNHTTLNSRFRAAGLQHGAPGDQGG